LDSAICTILKKSPSRPSAVLSITSTPFMGTAGIEPVTTSWALSGYFAQILPNSETCRRWIVPERMDVATRTLLLLWANRSSDAASRSSGKRSRISAGRLS
jgi:hypothetical protein